MCPSEESLLAVEPKAYVHWEKGSAKGRNGHAHAFVIDDLHSSWPHVR